MFVPPREPAFQTSATQSTLIAIIDLRNIRASRKGPSPSPWTSTEKPLTRAWATRAGKGRTWVSDYAHSPPQAARGTEMFNSYKFQKALHLMKDEGRVWGQCAVEALAWRRPPGVNINKRCLTSAQIREGDKHLSNEGLMLGRTWRN